MPPQTRGGRRPNWRGKRQPNKSYSVRSRTSGNSSRVSRRSANQHPSSARSSLSASSPALFIGRDRPQSYTSSSANYAQTPRSPNGADSLPISTPSRDDQTDDDLCEVFMAVEMKDRATIGCCYYVAAEETLYFMEDVPLGSVEVIEQLKLLIAPTVILVSGSADESVIQCLDSRSAQESSASGSGYDLPYLFEVRPPSEFKYQAGREKLIDLHIGAAGGPQVQYVVPGDASSVLGAEATSSPELEQRSRDARLIKLSGWVSVDSRHTVACVNALLAYLFRRRASAYLPRDPAAKGMFRISNVTMFTLQATMFINADTAISLQLMHPESHPSLRNAALTNPNSRSKEGSSLHGLFQPFAHTPQGKHLLRQYFLRPSLSLEIIRERHDAVACFMLPENETVFATGCKSMRGIGNARNLMMQLRRGMSAGSGRCGTIATRNWLLLQKFAFNAVTVFQAIPEFCRAGNVVIFAKIREHFSVNHLRHICNMISEIVDFEESDIQQRTVVRSSVDESLDEKKRLYAGLSDLLLQVANDIVKDVPVGLSGDLNVVYFPQIGFLVCMPIDTSSGRALWEGLEADPWERMFTGESVVYYKNSKMHAMDAHLGDVWTDICDCEIEILYNLAERILEFDSTLGTTSDLCAELDCLFALAQGARQYGFRRPQMVEENHINVEAGWHPLQKLAASTAYVPNDAYVKGGSDDATEVGNDDIDEGPNLVLLTGPNYSGKSAYLKQVAIIVYLAHIGSFVPAAAAQIGLTDKILTRVTTRESVSNPQSAFMTDLLQMSRALSLATPRSLLIIDEFGKGTGAAEGAGLAAGVLEYLASRGPRSPKVLAATHFHEILEGGFLTPRPNVQFAHMEISLAADEPAVQDQVAYLYTLKEGRSCDSLGAHCAAMCGVADDIVARAQELALMLARGEDLVTACAETTDTEDDELANAEGVACEFLDDDLAGDPRALLERLFRPPTAILIE